MRINERQFIQTDTDRANGSKKVDSKSGNSAKKATADVAVAKDSLVLSARAKDIADITLQLREASEVREDKVSELRARIQDGTYHVDGMDIAGKIMEKGVNKIF